MTAARCNAVAAARVCGCARRCEWQHARRRQRAQGTTLCAMHRLKLLRGRDAQRRRRVRQRHAQWWAARTADGGMLVCSAMLAARAEERQQRLAEHVEQPQSLAELQHAEQHHVSSGEHGLPALVFGEAEAWCDLCVSAVCFLLAFFFDHKHAQCTTKTHPNLFKFQSKDNGGVCRTNKR